ncbi:MAG TPA: TIGR03618 family F420-dependent PPOX class oxidoreductase [Sporichthyaceae bacterium]|jgi:PPOX class probable F420-dependent enzyme|nr:TIGR03618 family F420-dependent PPOX class oxidoreductase [Sporichthyaceae bacterium]
MAVDSPRVRVASHLLSAHDPAVAEFWTERHLCTLTTLRADGRPHVVPVGATLDAEAGLVRVIASRSSLKVRHVAAEPGGAPVAVCQVDGRRWSTVEGTATVSAEPADVAEAERRYALRYRTPRANPERVVLLIRIDRLVGNP